MALKAIRDCDMFPFPCEDWGANLISTLTFMRNVRSFRTLSRIRGANGPDGIWAIIGVVFPFPRED